jgi:hypothetical protein
VLNKCLIVVLVVGLTACAKGPSEAALTVEKSVRTTVVTASDLVEPIVCAEAARTQFGSGPCLKLLDVLEPTVDLAIAYNRALRTGTPPNITNTVAGIAKLIAAIRDIVPAGAAKDQALDELNTARVLAQGGK